MKRCQGNYRMCIPWQVRRQTEGIEVFKKGPAIDRALTVLFSCPSEGREEGPPPWVPATPRRLAATHY